MEDRYIEGRLFRTLDDGRTVEVIGDSYIENFELGGQAFNSYGADLGTLQNAYDYYYTASQDTSQQTDYTSMDTAKSDPGTKKVVDSRTKKFKTNYAGIHKKSVKELLAEAQKVHTIGGMHSIGSGSEMGGGTGMLDGQKKMFSSMKKSQGKGSYKAHMERLKKIMGGAGGEFMNAKTSSAKKMLSSKKSSRSGSMMGRR